MGKTRPPYPSEFRAEAVRAVHASGRPLAQLARDLGISPQTLASWVAQAGMEGSDPPLSAAERDDLMRLRKEVVLLREERDVLRRAAALFARESVRDRG
jgi:transposase